MRLVYSLVLLLLLSAAACTRPQTTSETTAPRLVAPVAVDVPTLAGYSIEEVRRQLGPPRETQLEPPVARPKRTIHKSLRVKDEGWSNTFEKNGVTLIVTFNARTRLVRDIVLTGSNEEELMQRGNLTLTAPNYIVLPLLNPQNTSDLLGVRVVVRL